MIADLFPSSIQHLYQQEDVSNRYLAQHEILFRSDAQTTLRKCSVLFF